MRKCRLISSSSGKEFDITQNTFITPGEFTGRRLDYVISSFTGLSRKKAREVVENGLVFLNDMRITFPSAKIKKGDKIDILKTGMEKEIKQEPIVLYEDDGLVVVNKPPGFLTEKISGEKGIAVTDFFKKEGKILFPVHRLDRETSGVMVFAKDIKMRDLLIEEFKSHLVDKTYIAVVEGRLQRKKGFLKGRIKKTGEFAETYYEIMALLKDATVLKLMPKTGRTHQLRLQFAELGHPIIGDKKYYNIKKTKIFFDRQALHSHKIKFFHPGTKRWMSFTASIPEDIKKLIDNLND